MCPWDSSVSTYDITGRLSNCRMSTRMRAARISPTVATTRLRLMAVSRSCREGGRYWSAWEITSGSGSQENVQRPHCSPYLLNQQAVGPLHTLAKRPALQKCHSHSVG